MTDKAAVIREKADDEIIQEHYRDQAKKHGASPSSTMEDDIIREREIEFIHQFVSATQSGRRRILDLGCGNGHTLQILSAKNPGNEYVGYDFTEELLMIARQRNLAECQFQRADARKLPSPDAAFDLVYTERCLINILSSQEQETALREIARVLKPGGHYLMIEAFTDGWENTNKARRECGLSDIPQAHHNRYFDKQRVLDVTRPLFELPDERDFDRPAYAFRSNFLSSHYFVSRVLYPSVLKGELVRNAEFIKFFSYLPPIGNYAAVQALIFRRRNTD